MGMRVFVQLPVDAQRARVMPLQPVHAEIALAGIGVLGMRQAQVEEHAAILGPGLDAGQLRQVYLVPLVDHLLAERRMHLLWRNVAQGGQLTDQLLDAEQALRHSRLEQAGDPSAYLVQPVHSERLAHALFRAEDVDGQRHARALHVLEQQSWTFALEYAANDLGDLETRVDFGPNANQLTLLLQLGKEVLQVAAHAANCPQKRR